MGKRIIARVTPMGAPRQTQRDRWAERPCVVRYRQFKDAMREAVGTVECGGEVNWIAYLPIPKSWSKRKKTKYAGQPHQQRPDRDNIDKAILDALFAEDCAVWSGKIEKRWDDGDGPRIELEFI